MGVVLLLELTVFAAFAVEEFVLIKPVSTVSQSDPVSRRLELSAIWWPAFGMFITAATLGRFGGVRMGGLVNAVGFLMCVAGLVLRYWSRRTLGRFFTIGVVAQKDHTVVRGGPYRFMRHPAYLGLTLLYVGFPLTIGHWPGLLILSAPALLIFVLLALVEDERLSALLGAPYRDYRSQVARWIPGVW
jgi:protein-S-isoprenylcysteine O-methyltransferase Ste14